MSKDDNSPSSPSGASPGELPGGPLNRAQGATERLSLKDKLTTAIALTSLFISAAVFWRSTFHVKNELQLTVASITTYRTGDVELTIAVLNAGNREAAVIRGGIMIWEDDFELADGWHEGGWEDFYSTDSFGGEIEAFSLKPGEIKVLTVKGKFDLELVSAQIWDSRLSRGKKNRTIAYGIGIDTLDGQGGRHHAEFPVAYWRFTVKGPEGLYTLGNPTADYALPERPIELFDIGIRRPYIPSDTVVFTREAWDLYTVEPQEGVRSSA